MPPFNKNQKGENKKSNQHAPKGKNFKKIEGSCYVCGKTKHKAKDCCCRKD